jgi:hypothetical protein
MYVQILDDLPVFKRYENQWPIQVILKRVLDNRSLDDASNCVTNCATNSQYSVERIPRHECIQFRPLQVSLKLATCAAPWTDG